MTKTALVALALALTACCGAPAPTPTPEGPGPGPNAATPLHPLHPPGHPGPGGGVSVDAAFPPERLALGHGYSIVVLTVLATDARGAATNEAPPAIVVRVDEVLAGDVAPGERPGQWSPPPSGVDWTGPSAVAARAEWARQPLPAPPAGLRVVALGRAVDGVFRVSAKLRDPYSDEVRAHWVGRIADERARRDAKTP